MINIKNSTYEELIQEYIECEKLWSKYSYDCFGFYIKALNAEIVKRGGWSVRSGKG